MKFEICENYNEMSRMAADIIIKEVRERPRCVLGLSTGSTPLETYRLLCLSGVDFSEATTVNLDEYYPISPNDEHSYRRYMNENLFSKINIDLSRTYVPNGEARDVERECRCYDALIEELGGIDLQILGIGKNGHIGFNEPGRELYCKTHMTELAQSTVAANARFFSGADEVPKRAITMGMGSILGAGKILLLACGKEKRSAVSALKNDMITTDIPATLLKLHKNVTVICDREAYE